MANERYLESREQDYAGMTLREFDYGELEDFYRKKQRYRLDLLTAEQASAGARPVVLLIHGGGFVKPCTRRQFYIPTLARYLTGAGYAVASPDYPVYETEQDRDGSGNRMPVLRPARAVVTALDFLRANAGPLGLDPRRVAVMGGSAGGMTAFYAVEMRKGAFRALVNLWGAPEPIPDLHGFPPTLSVHGTSDAMVPYARELRLQDALAAAGVPHRLISLEGCGHTPIDEADAYMPAVLELLRAAFSCRR